MKSILQKIYTFQTFDQVAEVMESLDQTFPELKSARLGLSELMVNAIEHGNLEISFEEKTEFMKSAMIGEEVASRLLLDAYKDRWARIEVSRFSDETVITISDEGCGFPWKSYLDRKLVDISGLHGRGMLLAETQFKTMTYIGNGNKVVAVVG